MLIAISALTFLVAIPAVHGQGEGSDHVQIGAFGSYYRSPQTHTNLAGLGGRFGLTVRNPLKFEGEMSYDFSQAFSEGFTNPFNGSISIAPSNVRALHGLFGPKLETSGSVQLFATLKGGFVNYRFDARPAGFSTFASSVDSLRTDNVDPVLYPGGGIEAHLGPLGLRFDIGDEIYFNNGSHHGMRLTFGPELRF